MENNQKKLKEDPTYKAAVKGAGLNLEKISDQYFEEISPKEIDVNKCENAAKKAAGLS